MASPNSCSFIGNIGRDPEAKPVGSDNKIVTASFAYEERWKDRKTGEWTGETSWFQMKGWGYDGDKILKFAKGDKVAIINASVVVETWGEGDGKKQAAVIKIGRDTTIMKIEKRTALPVARPDSGYQPQDEEDDLPFS